MKTVALKALLARIQTWPKGAQEEAAKALREIENDFFIEPELADELERARAEARRGDGISHKDLSKELGITDD